MKPADRHRDPLRTEPAGDRHGARKLIRLDADETDEARMTELSDLVRDALDRNPDVHFIVGVDLDRNLVAQNPPLGAIRRDGVKTSHGIRRNPGLPPLYDVTVLVVMRRLDDLDVKGGHGLAAPNPAGFAAPGLRPSPWTIASVAASPCGRRPSLATDCRRISQRSPRRRPRAG